MAQGKQIIGHSLIYALGNISRHLVSFIMLPVYTHYLTPADYGVVGLLIFLVSLIEIMFGGHMFQAVPKYYFEERSEIRQKKVVSTALIATFLFSGLSALALTVFRDGASFILFGSAEYSLYVAMFSVLILTHALENYAFTYIRILKKPWTFISLNLIKLGVQLSLNIITVVILELGLLGIAISAMASSILIASFLTYYTLSKTGLSFNSAIFRKLFRFSWPLWVSGIAGLYIGSSNRFFIQLFSDLDAVGLFELAAKFGAVISMLIWFPFSQYWQTERFKIAQQPDCMPTFRNVFLFVSTILVCSAMGLSILSKPVLEFMSDDSFHSAVKAIPYLAFAAVFQSLTYYNNFSFLLTENTGWVTRNTFLTATVITLLYIVLIPSFSYVGAAQAFMLGTIFEFSITFHFAKRFFDMHLPIFAFIIQLFISFYFIYLVSSDSNILPLDALFYSIIGSSLNIFTIFIYSTPRSIVINIFFKGRGKLNSLLKSWH
ncbi:oligosaccharide flippase family protein [Marinobacter pelagius]|uniref:lipopolysaccharide biosynthesis protein n=1 Tax=Marinobacter sp. C7 TaxID=2951363 RepID=UPI001EEF9F57|nr:oligosaccharide flippase family protein [Marinobacter sp. C7]MCG7199472.1 oligosaccharide flippase family protein [Marinobacter sp. C7]